MANGSDLRFKSQFNIGGIAQLLADKKLKEEQLKSEQQNRRMQIFNSVLQGVQLGSNLASAGLERSAMRQDLDQKVALADTLNQLGNLENRGNESVSFATPLPSGVQGPMEEPIRTRFNSTPQFQSMRTGLENKLENQILSMNPGSASQAVAQRRFGSGPSSLDIQEQEARIAKLKREANKTPNIPVSKEIVPDDIAVSVLKDIGKSDKYIEQLRKNRGGKLSITQKNLENILRANGVDPFNALFKSLLGNRNLGGVGGGGLNAESEVDRLLGNN